MMDKKFEVDSEVLVKYLEDMVGIGSVNPEYDWEGTGVGEEAIGDYLMDVLKEIGFSIETEKVQGNRRNVIGRIGGNGSKLLLTGHMDTVPPGDEGSWSGDPFELERKGNYLQGLGVSDMKGSIASMLHAAENIDPEELNGELIYAFVVDEEYYGKGMKKLVSREDFTSDGAIVGEPTMLNICTAHKGVVRYNINVKGRAVHSSRPWAGKNAISFGRKVIGGLEKQHAALQDEKHPLLDPPTLSVTMIRGGNAPNTIPDKCTLTMDRRTLPEEDKDVIEGSIRRTLDRIDDLDYELEEIVFARGMKTDTSSRIVQTCAEAAEEVLGGSQEFIGLNISTDGRFLVNNTGIPTVIFGPGDIEMAHSIDEKVKLDGLEKSTLFYRKCIQKFLS